MGQLKSDKDFREKLNQREIAPSENAWDRLDAMLTVAEEKKPKHTYGWLYIAAAAIGFIAIAAAFLSQSENVVDVKHEVVNENKINPKIIENQTPKTQIIPSVKDSESVAEVEVSNTNKPSIQTKSIIKSSSNQNNQTNQQKSIINQKNDVIAPIENQQAIASTINRNPMQQTQAKVDELLASVKNPEASDKAVIKVDAKSLLSQVDNEVNTSFREKMLRKINKNYQEVAEAVSTRNVQQ